MLKSSQGRGVQLIKKWPDLKPLLREVWPDGIDAKVRELSRQGFIPGIRFVLVFVHALTTRRVDILSCSCRSSFLLPLLYATHGR